MARRYDPDRYHTESPLPIRLLERKRVDILIQQMEASNHHRVLEVGVGAGNVLERVKSDRRIGIDLSEFLLAKARRRLPGVPLLRMDAQSLAFEDDTFDRVYCTEVLEHVPDPRRVVAEMRRVLKPEGIAVISVPNEEMINRVKRAAFSLPLVSRWLASRDGYEVPEHMEDEWHLHEFGRQELEATVAGEFKVVTMAGVPNRIVPLRWVAKLRHA